MKIKPKINLIKHCMNYWSDENFINFVENYQKDDTLINLVQYGEKDCPLMLYHIAPGASKSGFFADYNKLLCFLYYADYYKLTPVIEYSREFSYAENHPVNGHDNPYEYYFKQPTEVSIAQIYQYRTVLRSRKENTGLAGGLRTVANGYSINDQFLNEMARINAKYIKMQPEIDDMIKQALITIKKGKKILGVHVRGTDFKRNYKRHPINLSAGEYLQAAKEVFDYHDFTHVFLATDDLQAVDLFQSEFGNNLCLYQDVIRSSADETVMKSKVNRENHHFQLGFEVLRDMHTLAECDGLVAGLSQVSIAAQIQKKSYGKEYVKNITLSKGINT